MAGLLILILSMASAGILKLQSESSLILTPWRGSLDSGSRGDLHLRGLYLIRNEGDETASQVFPVIAVDRFRWIGESKDIPPGQQHSWVLDQVISKKNLCLEVSQDCPVALPLKGVFLGRVEKHYRDSKGYQFVVPDVLVLQSGGTEETFSESSPELDFQFGVQGEKTDAFVATYSLRNLTDSTRKIALTSLLPRELGMEGTLYPVKLESRREVEGTFYFKNLKGLPGSLYFAILIAEWSDGKKRQGKVLSSPFQIRPKKPPATPLPQKIFWLCLSGLLLGGLVLMWFFWLRPLRNFRSY